jgi:hypothetical protein
VDHSTNLAFWLASGAPLFAAVAAFYMSRKLKLVWRTLLILAVLAVSLPAGFVLVLIAIDRGPEFRRPVDGFATFFMILVWCIAVFGSAVTLIGLAFDAAKRKWQSKNPE